MSGRTKSSTQVMIDQISHAVISQRPGDDQAGQKIIADAAGKHWFAGPPPSRDLGGRRPRRDLWSISVMRPVYSTVTDFARLRGWSTSVPMAAAV